MFLKKASIVSTVAVAAVATSVSAVSAAESNAVATSAFTINGVSANLHTFSANGATQVALRELGTQLGAGVTAGSDGYTVELNGHVVELKLNSKVAKVDGVDQQWSAPVSKVGDAAYADLKALVEALGASLEAGQDGTTWIDANLLQGADRVQWLDANRLIASQDTEDGRVDYLVNAKTGSFVKLSLAAGASELAIAPNGHVAAYTNEAGEVYIVELNSRLSFKVSADTNIKPELVWAADSSAIYFLQGDKGSVIAKLDLKAEKISVILDDKVDYKSNLGVSNDGKTFTYTVTKPGTVVADANKPVDEDDVSIDTKGTEPQVYAYTVDPSNKDNKPVQLTTSTDNKVFFSTAADGSSVSFVSVGTDDAALSKLLSVAKDKTTKTLFDKADVYDAAQSGSSLILLTAGEGDNEAIYEVDASGNSKLLYSVSGNVSEVVAKDGALAIVDDGRVYVNVGGQWKPTTR